MFGTPDRPVTLDPTHQWERELKRQTVESVEPRTLLASADLKTPAPPGYLRCVCISDTHTMHERLELPDGDVLLHAGDFTSTGKPAEIKAFCDWLRGLEPRFKHRIVIAGNHDLTLDQEYYDARGYERFHAQEGGPKPSPQEMIDMVKGSCTYLADSGVSIEGVRFWGSPWQPEFFDWAFNLKRGEELREKWQLVPADTDVLLTHGPPLGFGDLSTREQRTGCFALLQEIQQRIRPQFHVSGHIHEGHGITRDGRGTTYVNASSVGPRYRRIQAPIVFDIRKPDGTVAAAAGGGGGGVSGVSGGE